MEMIVGMYIIHSYARPNTRLWVIPGFNITLSPFIIVFCSYRACICTFIFISLHFYYFPLFSFSLFFFFFSFLVIPNILVYFFFLSMITNTSSIYFLYHHILIHAVECLSWVAFYPVRVQLFPPQLFSPPRAF